MATAWVPRNPRKIEGPAQVREILDMAAVRRRERRCTPASMLTCVRFSPPSSWPRTGETVTYRELEARSNRLAHLFRERGLKRLDHYSIFMENNSRYLEACGAGERSGLYYTCVNSYLTAGELAYILTNSQSRILITSTEKLDVAREALKECPKVELCIVVDGDGESDRIVEPAATRRPACRTPRSPTNASAPRCCIRRAPRAGRRASCARCRNCRPTSSCRCSISW